MRRLSRGRPVASIWRSNYSTGSTSMGAWGEAKARDVANIAAYLAEPKDAVKTTRKALAGLKMEKATRNVVTSLAQ